MNDREPHKVSMTLYVTETTRLIRDGKKWGRRDIIYLSLHCHHQNDSCINMGSDESHFKVSLIVRDKSGTVSADHNFQEKGKPKRIRTEVPLLTSLNR